VGPQIQELFKDDRFNSLLQGDAIQEWTALSPSVYKLSKEMIGQKTTTNK